jgi:hypothetical protein
MVREVPADIGNHPDRKFTPDQRADAHCVLGVAVEVVGCAIQRINHPCEVGLGTGLG